MFLSAFCFDVYMVNQKDHHDCWLSDVIEGHFNKRQNVFASKFCQHDSSYIILHAP